MTATETSNHTDLKAPWLTAGCFAVFLSVLVVAAFPDVLLGGPETILFTWLILALLALGDWVSCLSLTPGFSWVLWTGDRRKNRFNGLPQAVETVETVPTSHDALNTQLKLVVNETSPSAPKLSAKTAPINAWLLAKTAV